MRARKTKKERHHAATTSPKIEGQAGRNTEATERCSSSKVVPYRKVGVCVTWARPRMVYPWGLTQLTTTTTTTTTAVGLARK